MFGLLTFACGFVFNPNYCAHLIEEQTFSFDYYMFKVFFTEKFICSHLLNVCPDHKLTKLRADDFVSRVLANKPVSIQDDDYLDTLYESFRGQTGRDTYTILHIADWHIDLEYEEGASITCDEIVCCHATHGFPSDTNL